MTAHKHVTAVLISPRITEKAADLSAQRAYVFNVALGTNKREIADAVELLYKVVPKQVKIVITPRKRVKTRGTNRRGYTARRKKAYVYLRSGDTIEFA